MRKELLDNDQIASIPISVFVKKMYGVSLESRYGGRGEFLRAVWRGENTPSVHVTDDKVWYDHGTGVGGGIWELARVCFGTNDNMEVRKRLTDLMAGTLNPHQKAVFAARPKDVVKKESASKVLEVFPMNNTILLDYMHKRGVAPMVAAKETKVVLFTTDGENKRWGIGFKSNSGGYEIRTEHCKLSIGPKDITYIKRGEQESSTLAIFEGFMDFLSYRTMVPDDKSDVLVLNGVSLCSKVEPYLDRYSKVKLFLDSDQAGREASKKIEEWSHSKGFQVEDMSDRYKEYNDVNEYLVAWKKKHSPVKEMAPKPNKIIKKRRCL